MKRKLLFIVPSLRLAGAEKVVYTLANSIDRNSFEVSLCCIMDKGMLLGTHDYFPMLKESDIKIHFLKKRYSKDILLLLELVAFIWKERPDLIHSHIAPIPLYASFSAWLNFIPCIVTLHGMGKEKSSFCDKAIRTFAKFLVTVCKERKKKLIENGLDPQKIVTIYNGIKLPEKEDVAISQEIRNAHKIAENDFVYGCVANLHIYKNIKLLIKSFGRIYKSSSEPVKLILIGTGPELENLKKMTRELNLEEKVIFLGQRNDVLSILHIIDVFVLPSNTEGLSISILEAMASSKPVIATDVGGNKEVVENNQTGIIVPPEDEDALFEAMKYLMENREVGHKMGEAGRKRVEDHFSLDRMVHEYEELYEKCLNKKSGKN